MPVRLRKRPLLTATAHCLDTIRQVLMCNVDTAVLGQVWANKEEPLAFPDFNTRHMCKNYDAVRAWSERLQVRNPASVFGAMLIAVSRRFRTRSYPSITWRFRSPNTFSPTCRECDGARR